MTSLHFPLEITALNFGRHPDGQDFEVCMERHAVPTLGWMMGLRRMGVALWGPVTLGADGRVGLDLSKAQLDDDEDRDLTEFYALNDTCTIDAFFPAGGMARFRLLHPTPDEFQPFQDEVASQAFAAMAPLTAPVCVGPTPEALAQAYPGEAVTSQEGVRVWVRNPRGEVTHIDFSRFKDQVQFQGWGAPMQAGETTAQTACRLVEDWHYFEEPAPALAYAWTVAHSTAGSRAAQQLIDEA